VGTDSQLKATSDVAVLPPVTVHFHGSDLSISKSKLGLI
jgi:hypothetical protein